MTNEELFLRANEQYKAQEYAAALSSYQSITHKGPATWYNMGNSAYKTGDFAQARLYWRRAQQAGGYEQQKDSAYNLDLLDQALGTTKGQTAHYTDQFLLHVRSASLGLLQVSFLCVWFLFFFFASKLARKKRHFLLFLLIILNGVLGVCVFYRYTQAHCRSGIVTAPTVSIYAGPDSNYHEVGTITAQTEFCIQEIREDWYKVRVGRLNGWIPKGAGEPVQNDI